MSACSSGQSRRSTCLSNPMLESLSELFVDVRSISSMVDSFLSQTGFFEQTEFVLMDSEENEEAVTFDEFGSKLEEIQSITSVLRQKISDEQAKKIGDEDSCCIQ